MTTNQQLSAINNRLDSMDKELSHLHQMAQHSHDMAHHIHDMLHAINAAAECSDDERSRLSAASKTLKESAARLSKVVAANPLPTP